MIIVEHLMRGPILQKTFQQAPDMRIVLEQESATSEGPVRLLFWAEGPDFEAFEAAMEADPTVTDVTCLARTDATHLYRARLTEQGMEVTTMNLWMELDIVLLHATRSVNGWEVRMRFPDRDALGEFRAYCDDHDLDFKVLALYSTDDTQPVGRFGVTEPQRDTLLAAVESGYFSIPRESSLAELADQLGLSSQATSERLRRGTEALVRNTLTASR
jgi:predicted DNA binding protein